MRKQGEITVMSYNIRNGRSMGLLSAARTLGHANVNIAVVQETKIADPTFPPKKGFGYSVLDAAAGT